MATVVGLAHALVVAPRYHVGSFDDDASYVMAARALASGAGLTTKLAPVGAPLVGVYPPGYPALLAPLAHLWPHGVLPFRAVSLVCYLVLFPLTWVYLSRRRVAPPVALAVLLLLALNPVAATFATMVMPEMAFLVALLLLLLVLPRWEREPKALSGAGAATIVLAASLIWLKEAGVGLAIGVVAWLLLRRLWRKALAIAVGLSVLMLPLLVARAVAGVPLIGSRYSTELGGPYQGGLTGRILHMAPAAAWTYAHEAIPRTIIPTYVSPLPLDGPISGLLAILEWTATPLVILGFAVWWRRHRDVACVAVALYLLETLIYPYTNERRVILVLPVMLIWYCLGAAAAFRVIVGPNRTAVRHSVSRARMAVPVAAVMLASGALIPQLPRDYLFDLGQDSSSPAGSPYLQFLAAVGRPADVVETSYLWSTALFSGLPTADGAFQVPCDQAAVTQALQRDGAGFVLSAALNRPRIADAYCLLPIVADLPGAVRLYRSPIGVASVFELLGAAPGHRGLRDLVAGTQPTAVGAPVVEVPEAVQMTDDPAGTSPATETVGGRAVMTWSWGGPAAVSQISLGGAGGKPATTTSVMIELLGPDGTWHPIAAAPGPVGATQATRYLVAHFPQPTVATAVRVVISAQGTAEVQDLHVLGPIP